MDSEKPRTLGSIATRIACTFVGVVILYVAGVGPAWCVLRFTENGEILTTTLYAPLWRATEKTPLEKPLDAYVTWWVDHWPRHDSNNQHPSATPLKLPP